MDIFTYQGSLINIKKHINYIKGLNMQIVNTTIHNPLSFVCYASLKNSYIFRPDGEIIKCSIDLDHGSNQIGYIDSRLGVIIDESKNKKWYATKLNSNCYKCDSLIQCLNKSCPRSHVLNLKTPNCLKMIGEII